MLHAHTVSEPERVKRVQSFLSGSLKDYIASRVLFLAELPQQAAILSSTALEKSFKAILAIKGNICHGHLKEAHWNGVKNLNKELFDQLDKDFLELNRKAYLLRYTDDLPLDFNLVVATREFLAELDRTMAAIHSGFSIQEFGTTHPTEYGHQIATQDQRLLTENQVFSGITATQFVLAKPQFVYEVRNGVQGGLVELLYTSSKPAKFKGFLRPGFVPKDNADHSYDLSHFPMPPS